MDHGHRGLSSLLAGSLLLLLVACDGSSSPTQPGGPVSFTTIHSGTSLGFSPFSNGTAINDRGTWQGVWEQLGRTGSAPAVDFSREMVLLATGPGCGGETTIRSVTQDRGRVVVDALATSCDNVICIAADYSVHAVRVSRTSGAVDFVVSSVSKHC
ncbi:MAG TPA: hypothetical protein VGV61_09625 [Thermoanaerobaculia bacterium]|jgi:hypothetical protein|nr:hypothetical protein [Thermoanaerobaculia bacterium]